MRIVRGGAFLHVIQDGKVVEKAMRSVMGIFLFCFMMISCVRRSAQEPIALAKLGRILSNYGLDHDLDERENSDLIVFSKQGRWVSNYHVIMKKDQGDFKIIYHEADKMNQELQRDMIFFQGVVFYMDSARLSKVFLSLDALRSTVSEDSYSDGVLDGTDYLLYYDGHAYAVNQGSGKEQFEAFSSYLMDSLILPAMSARKVLPSE